MESRATANELLGYPADARVLIITCDDLGLYRAVNAGVLDAIEHGIAASCSLMVPAPAAGAAIELLGQRSGIPFGVHLTLVCDFEGDRWGPVADRALVRSLLADDGAFHSPSAIPRLLREARLDEVEIELRTQIEVVLRAGLSPTHLDWHCLADGGRDDLLALTLALAAEYRFAARVWGGPARSAERVRGRPAIDHDFVDSFALPLDHKAERYAAMLRDLPPGLSEWAVHPALEDDQARDLDPGLPVRTTDHAFLVSTQAREILREERITVIGYRGLQEAWTR